MSVLAARSRRPHVVSLAAVIGAATVFGLTYGLSAPLIALDLAERGAPEWQIGLNAAMHALGVLLIAPALPRLAAQVGTRRLLVLALCVAGLVLAAFPALPLLAVWFALRLLLGMACEVIFVLTETWTNDLAGEQTRARTMAVYTAVLSAGFAGGPAIVAVAGSETGAYLIGAGLALAAIVPIAWRGVARPARFEHAKTPAATYLRLAPLAIATTVLNSAVETAGLSFLPLYAQGRGWTEAQGLQLVTTLLVGAILLQLPLGWLADKVSRRGLVIVLAVITAVTAFVWPSVFAAPLLAHAFVFVWGGLFVGIYTVMLAVVGSRFSGADLVGVYAVMGSAWGVGALLGPTTAGFAMHLSADHGLPYAIGSACALYAGYALLHKGA
jgi:MFS family permease